MHTKVSKNTLLDISSDRVKGELNEVARRVNSSVIPFAFIAMFAAVLPDMFQFPNDWQLIVAGRLIIAPLLIACWWLGRKQKISGYLVGTLAFCLIGTQPGIIFHIASPETLLPVNVVLFALLFGIGFLLFAQPRHIAIVVGCTVLSVSMGIATTENYTLEDWALQGGILNVMGLVFAFLISRNRIKLQSREILSRLALEDSLDLLDQQNHELQEAKETLEGSNQMLEQKVIERTASLQKSHSEMDAMIYRLSHDFKMPLVNVRSLVMMAREEAQGESIQRLFDLIDSSLDNFDGVMEDMNRFVAFSNREIVLVECSLQEIVERVWNKASEGQASELTLNVQSALPGRIKTDPVKLELVLDCLFRNAYQYSKEDTAGEITVLASVEGEKLQIQVKDNGIGIDPEVLPRVFDLFFRGNSRSKGLGIGLYLAKGIMDQLSGDLKLASVGEGTTAEISLPMAQ